MPVTALAVGFDPPSISCMKKVKVWPRLPVEALVAAATPGLGCADGCGGTTGSGGSSSRVGAEEAIAMVKVRNRR